MPAPRRIGKTWTLNRLASDLSADGWQAIEVDVQGMRTPTEFGRDLCKRIESQSRIKDRFRSHMKLRMNSLLGGGWGGDNLFEALTKVDPIEFADSLISTVLPKTDCKRGTAIWGHR